MSDNLSSKDLERLLSRFITKEGDTNNASKRKSAFCNHCHFSFSHSIATRQRFVQHLSCCTSIPRDLLQDKRTLIQSLSKSEKQSEQAYDMTSFTGRVLTEGEFEQANKYLARWFATSAIPYAAIENEWLAKFINVISPSFKLVSRKTLSTVLIPKEYEEVLALVRSKIGESLLLSVIFDGWTDITGKSIYAVVVAFDDGTEQLFDIFDASADSHTAEYLASKFYDYLVEIGLNRVAAVVSDNAANMKAARANLLLRPDCSHLLNIRCFMHAFGVTMGSIMGHPQIKTVVTLCQKVVTHIRASHQTLANLTLRARNSNPPINSGLKTSNTTRLTSTFLCISSVLTHQKVLRAMVHAKEISNEVVIKIIMDGSFWITLHDVYYLLKPLSDVIMSIQGKESLLADVARYWIYLTHSLSDFISGSSFSKEVLAHIQYAFNIRTVEIPPIASLLALFLDPRFRESFTFDSFTSE